MAWLCLPLDVQVAWWERKSLGLKPADISLHCIPVYSHLHDSVSSWTKSSSSWCQPPKFVVKMKWITGKSTFEIIKHHIEVNSHFSELSALDLTLIHFIQILMKYSVFLLRIICLFHLWDSHRCLRSLMCTLADLAEVLSDPEPSKGSQKIQTQQCYL